VISRQILIVVKPESPSVLDSVVIDFLQGLVFRSSCLVHRFPKMLVSVEPMVKQLGAGQVLRDGVGVGREHIGGASSHATALPRRQAVKDPFCSYFRAIRSDLHDARSVSVREYGGVTLTLSEALLVNAGVSDRLLITTLESAFNRSAPRAMHDRVGGVL
jgi:hypothetical protein